ncbi:MAG: gamma-glutamylcyclotransferase [Streptosporangiaceae bacterium]
MALMFLNGGGMRGGPVHRHIDGVPLVGERRTAPRYRFYSIRDEYPGLYPAERAGADGQPILGELYDVPMDLLRSLLASEPPELELSIVELESAQLSFGMILRDDEQRRGSHADITSYGSWRAYRATLSGPVGA